jgi:hypothetical protein
MNTAIETAIFEKLRTLDKQHQAEVLDFVEFLAIRRANASWSLLDPARDFPKFAGSEPIHRQPGSAKGVLQVLSADDAHLDDFRDYMPMTEPRCKSSLLKNSIIDENDIVSPISEQWDADL